MSRVDMVREESYTIEAEHVDGCVFLHCQVNDSSKSVLKDVKDAFEVIMLESSLAGISTLFSQTHNLRFVKFLGKPYKVLEEFDYEGKNMKVIAWDLW